MVTTEVEYKSLQPRVQCIKQQHSTRTRRTGLNPMISRPLLSNHLSCRYHAISRSVALYLIIILAVRAVSVM